MPLICPVCRKDMEATSYMELQLDWCRLCGGLWFDGGEVEKLTTYKNIPKRLTHPIAYDYSEKKIPEGERLCPRCMDRMKVIDYQNVKVDVCTKCRGIWFDRYELAKTIGSNDKIPKHEFDYEKEKQQQMIDSQLSSTGPASLSPYSGLTGRDVGDSYESCHRSVLGFAIDLISSFLP
ncbi:MAG: zf-TFIIB domain-containing protein [Candidatus Xenobiia bacterium LiM19]